MYKTAYFTPCWFCAFIQRHVVSPQWGQTGLLTPSKRSECSRVPIKEPSMASVTPAAAKAYWGNSLLFPGLSYSTVGLLFKVFRCSVNEQQDKQLRLGQLVLTCQAAYTKKANQGKLMKACSSVEGVALPHFTSASAHLTSPSSVSSNT